MMNRVGYSFMRNVAINRQAFMCTASRSYLKDLGLDSQSLAKREEDGVKASEVQLWKAQADATKNALVLKSSDEIE